MGKASRKRNKGGKQSTKIKAVPKPANDIEDEKHPNFPTRERQAHNAFRRVGMGKHLVPVIDRLLEAKVLTTEEHRALSYYRDQASLADKSPVRSCCDFSPRGGHGPGVAIMSAAIETGRIERNMGALWSLCRAVCVDDVTLEEWCLARHGSMNTAGEPVANPSHVGIATLELKYAAGGIVGR